MGNERAESRGSQAFCGLARLERWDLAGCGPLASLLKQGRKKNHSQKMKRAKSYAKNAQARSNTLGSFLLPAFLFPQADLNNRWDQPWELSAIHSKPCWVTEADSGSLKRCIMSTSPPLTHGFNLVFLSYNTLFSVITLFQLINVNTDIYTSHVFRSHHSLRFLDFIHIYAKFSPTYIQLSKINSPY